MRKPVLFFLGTAAALTAAPASALVSLHGSSMGGFAFVFTELHAGVAAIGVLSVAGAAAYRYLKAR